MSSRDADQYMVRFPDGCRDDLKSAASDNGRSLNAEIIHRLNCYSNPEGLDMPKSDQELVYTPPEAMASARRVYDLPVELVKRIHAYGFENGHASEVSAVRELLNKALASLSSQQGLEG